jgi:NADH-quinone oxidoreductase subunit G
MTDVIRTTVTITVNGRAIEAQPGELLIEAAERAGTYVPRFCYHPRMEPVGVCRMCLVEVDGPRGATLQPACYLKVNEGMNVVTDSEKVKKAQDGVIEFLLANHPLDCPVCDKGGECPLQDQTLAHGSGETRFVEEKRHFVKPIEIGELVLLDRERCIQCARCTRFASEVAGDAQIAFAGRGDLVEVATSPTQPFDSVFSGNTVQICPVGALTAKPYRFSARPWDLEQVESTCTTCALGCRVAVQSSGNRLTRVLGVDSEPVNHGWLCDKGRFTLDSIDGNEASTDPLLASTRITEPMIRRNGVLAPVSWGEALAEAARLLRDASSTPHGVGAIGGAALTNEGAFAWERFLRGVLGTENIDAQYGDGLDAALLQALPLATIDEAANAPTVITLTGDLREELPVLFLRLRESAVRYHRSIVQLAFGTNSLTSVARVSLPVRPGEAHLVAHALTHQGDVPKGVVINETDLAEARRLIGASGRCRRSPERCRERPGGRDGPAPPRRTASRRKVPARAASFERRGSARHGTQSPATSGTGIRRVGRRARNVCPTRRSAYGRAESRAPSRGMPLGQRR